MYPNLADPARVACDHKGYKPDPVKHADKVIGPTLHKLKSGKDSKVSESFGPRNGVTSDRSMAPAEALSLIPNLAKIANDSPCE